MLATKPPKKTTKAKKQKAPKAPKPGTSLLAEQIPIAWIEPDGLMVTTDGRLARLIAIDRAPNLYSSTPGELGRLESIWQRAAAVVPDEQELWWYALRDPLPLGDAVAEDRAAMEVAVRADMAAGDKDSARMRARMEQMTELTIAHGAAGDIAASLTRHYALLIWEPKPETGRELWEDVKRTYLPGGDAGPGVLPYNRYAAAALDTDAQVAELIGLLSDVEADPRRVDAVETLALLWERLHPAARALPNVEDFEALAEQMRHDDEETGAAKRAQIIDTLAAGIPEHDIPDAHLDPSDDRWIRHADGTVEEVLHLSTVPQQTSLFLLAELTEVPLAATLAVRICPGSRLRERRRARLRDRQKSAAVRDAARKGRDVSDESIDGSDEAREAVRELSQTAGASIYKVGVYLSLRCPWGDTELLGRTAQRLAKHMLAQHDAKLARGRFLSVSGFTTTLPIGVDRINARRSYAHRSLGHMVPVSSARCGTPGGIFLGWSDPGATLERLDPFHDDMPNHVMLVAGRGGTGKTFAVNTMLMRALARGMRGRIIDASTTDAGDGGRRSNGHYDALVSLVPDGERVSIGTGGGDVLCPWDVPNVANVPPAHVETLLAIHDLLIGETRDEGDLQLTADHRALLRRAIAAVYDHAAETRERPCESLLHRELLGALEREEDEHLRSQISSLLVRIEPYVGDGPLAYLLDHATTVNQDPQLLVYDLAGTPESLLPAVMMIATAETEREAERLKQEREAGSGLGGVTGNEWSMIGRMFLAIDEGSIVINTNAGGRYMNKQGRRSRHLALWFIFITQQLADLDSPNGRVLLGQSSMLLQTADRPEVIEPVAKNAGLNETDLETIGSLTTRKGLFSNVYLVHRKGRGVVQIALSDAEKWAIASDPRTDQPLRARALQESGGDPWEALAALADPDWRATALAA